MAKWRKRPVLIEAERVSLLLTYARDTWQANPAWFRDGYERGDLILLDKEIHVRTLEGLMTAGWTDWLIQGVKGELYPCKDDIFRATYELVDDGAGHQAGGTEAGE